MFKAKLINTPGYHRLKRQLIIISLIILPFLVFINPLYHEIWPWMIPIGLIVVIGFYISFKINRRIAKMLEDQIEIDYQRIIIKDKSGKLKEEIALDAAKNIITKDVYQIPGDEIEDVYNQMRNDHLRNFLSIETDHLHRLFEFQIDSYYSIRQIEKIIQYWEESGLPVFSVPDINHVT